jgi:hypothetical protein
MERPRLFRRRSPWKFRQRCLLFPLLVLGLWLCFEHGPLERRSEPDWSDVA